MVSRAQQILPEDVTRKAPALCTLRTTAGTRARNHASTQHKKYDEGPGRIGADFGDTNLFRTDGPENPYPIKLSPASVAIMWHIPMATSNHPSPSCHAPIWAHSPIFQAPGFTHPCCQALLRLLLTLPSTGGEVDRWVLFDDLHAFDLVNMTWTNLSVAGTQPSARYSHGFTSAGGKLYVHGGTVFKGESVSDRDPGYPRIQRINLAAPRVRK